MSDNTPQFPNAQGNGPQGFAPNNQSAVKSSGSSTKTILIIVGIVAVLGLVCCGGFTALLLPAVSAAREAALRTQDQNNMKFIGLAFHNYESTFKALPYPCALNSKKEKVWSWTVSILPYTDVQLFKRLPDKLLFNMQPWDSPENSLLQGESPKVLKSSRAKHPPESNLCNVFVISVPTNMGRNNPAFREGNFNQFPNFLDGLDKTILAIMLVKHSVPWASPTTLSPDEAYQLIQQEDEYFIATMGDGSMKEFPTTLNRASFDALITPMGGESIDVEALTYKR